MGVAFLRQTTQPEGIRLGEMLIDDMQKYRGGEPAVESVTIIGPYDATGLSETASRQKIFTCQPGSPQDETACAREILSLFGAPRLSPAGDGCRDRGLGQPVQDGQ